MVKPPAIIRKTAPTSEIGIDHRDDQHRRQEQNREEEDHRRDDQRGIGESGEPSSMALRM